MHKKHAISPQPNEKPQVDSRAAFPALNRHNCSSCHFYRDEQDNQEWLSEEVFDRKPIPWLAALYAERANELRIEPAIRAISDEGSMTHMNSLAMTRIPAAVKNRVTLSGETAMGRQGRK
jgi:hypothetical protein